MFKNLLAHLAGMLAPSAFGWIVDKVTTLHEYVKQNSLRKPWIHNKINSRYE